MPAGHIRILHLEDCALDAELIEQELKRAKLNFSSTRVETERSFRDELESSDPDVILADYNLPGFDGIAALKIARELVPDTPFIFVSGSIGEERAVQALLEGAVDYVVKDRPARLASAMVRAIGDRRERQHRQRTQEALKRSEERYTHAANATQEVILDWDLRSNRVVFNEALKTIWGYQPDTDEVSSDWVFERIHPEERESIERSKREAVERGDRWEGSYRFLAADGSYGHVLERAVVVRDGGGQPLRVICALLDVSEQRISEELMRKSERRFRSLAQTASDAIVITDSASEIVFVNGVGQTYFGYSLDELLGKPVEMLMPERNRASYRAGIEEILETGTGTLLGGTRQVHGLRRDGDEFPVDVVVSSWRVDGEVFFTTFLRSATERVGLERRQKIELAVARVLFDAGSTREGIHRLLREIGHELGWKVGLYWCLAEGEKALHCDEVWCEEGFDATELFDASRAMEMSLGEGVPNLVWKRGKSLVIVDSRDHPDDPRIKPILQLGLRGGFAFPVVETSGVTAVVEFYDIQPLQPHDVPLISAMDDVGRRVGEFLQRGRAEKKLKASEMNLADAQRLAQLGSYSFHMPTGIVEWSDETYRIFGLPPRKYVPSTAGYLNLVHPDERSEVAKVLFPPYSSESMQLQHRIVRADGSIRVIFCRLRIMEGTAANPVRVMGTIQDITERVEAEETIVRLGRQNRSILDSAAEAIIGAGSNGKVMFANPAAVAITGFSAHELMAAPSVHELLRHTEADGTPIPREKCPVVQTIADGTTREGTATYRKKSGERLSVEFAASPMVMDGEHGGCVLSFIDITKRQALERRLEQANRVSSLGRVAAMIAHEFNNVLMGIQPFAEVIRRRSGGDEKIQNAASQILNSVSRGKRVTQEILRFTQPSPPALKTTVLSEWLDGVLPELCGLAGKRIEIKLDHPATPVACCCDPSQMHQVITNLVLNARDAIAVEGSIVIALDGHPERRAWPFGRVPDGMVLMSVSDTGAGMPPEVMASIFEPLFTTKRSGTGLGLAVAHQILASHHGSIHASSTPGSGTTFYLVLPRATKESEPVIEHRRLQAVMVHDVLLVEDELVVAAGIAALLESEGIKVWTVHRGREATAAIEAKLPDLVLLDVSLPDVSGVDVYQVIAQRWPSLPVIFSTGHADETMLEKSLRARHVGFLRKPYDRETLLRAIEQVVSPAEVEH